MRSGGLLQPPQLSSSTYRVLPWPAGMNLDIENKPIKPVLVIRKQRILLMRPIYLPFCYCFKVPTTSSPQERGPFRTCPSSLMREWWIASQCDLWWKVMNFAMSFFLMNVTASSMKCCKLSTAIRFAVCAWHIRLSSSISLYHSVCSCLKMPDQTYWACMNSLLTTSKLWISVMRRVQCHTYSLAASSGPGAQDSCNLPVLMS